MCCQVAKTALAHQLHQDHFFEAFAWAQEHKAQVEMEPNQLLQHLEEKACPEQVIIS
jgi:hypothetical protein